MSNTERWDHSGYNELNNEEKSNNFKKQLGNKKPLYKYKDNTTPNEKPNSMEYLDISQMNNRKNQSKKFTNYNYNTKYHNDEWSNDNEKSREITSAELFDSQNGPNSFKPKFKKTKKKGEGDYQEGPTENKSVINEFYNKNLKNEDRGGNQNSSNQNYSLSGSNYGSARPIEQVSSNSSTINNTNNLNNSNYNGNRNKINNQGGSSTNSGGRVNNMGGNSGFNNNNNIINQNYQSNSKYLNSNAPYQYNNSMSSPYNVKNSVGDSNNFNLNKRSSCSQLYNVQENMSNANNHQMNQSPNNSTDSNSHCQRIVMHDNSYARNEEDDIMQQNHLVSNEIYGSNSKKQNKINQNNNFTIENTDIHNITRNSDEKNSLPNTPTRNSGNNFQSSTTTHSSMHMNSQTPGNSVGFSPKTNADPIYMSNMIKMPNNYNFNSPIMHDNFMYPNYPNNTRNNMNMNNMSGQYYGMMNGINPMNMNTIEPNNFQTMQNNYNPSMNPNYGNFPFNPPPHHMPMIPQMKGPMVNNMPLSNVNIHQSSIQHSNKNIQSVDMFKHNNNLNIHNEEMYNPDLRSSGKKSSNPNMSNNSIQMPRGINNSVINNSTMNPNNLNLFERTTGNSNAYNNNPSNKKGGMQPPYNNNFINNNINISNLNYNQMNLNNKNFNNRKINNNFNSNINNISQNPLQRMKFVKSDKNLTNIQNPNTYKIQQNTQDNQMELAENSNLRSSNNKIWRDNKSGNPGNIDTLTNIINSTIKSSGNTSYNKNNPSTYSSFNSIKEEQQATSENYIKNKQITNLESQKKEDAFFENEHFSSNDSKYSIAEEEIKYEDKDFLLLVSVRISGKEEMLGINNKEDSMTTIKKFISKHRLNEKLIKPISEKITNAMSSIDSLLQSKIDSKDYKSLKEIKKMYTPKIEEEKVPDLDLSCFTYLGESDSYCGFNFNLSKEEAKTTEKLNMSR